MRSTISSRSNLRQCGEDAEDQLAAGGRRIDGGTMPGQHLEADAACGQVMHGVDQGEGK